MSFFFPENKLTGEEAKQLANFIKPIIFLSKQTPHSRCVLRLRRVIRLFLSGALGKWQLETISRRVDVALIKTFYSRKTWLIRK